MALPKLVILVFVGLVVTGTALKLPDYITPCQRSSADFQQCALDSAKKALPHVIEGDRKYRMPSLDPVSITSMAIETPGSIRLKLALTDLKIYGYRATELRTLNVDLAAGTINYSAWIPKWELIGQYDVAGQVVLLPVSGQGDCNITLVNVAWTSTLNFENETRANGKHYIKVTDYKHQFTTTRSYTKFDNLFNGNKILGDQLNGFISDNWEEMLDVMKPFFVEALKTIFMQTFNGIFGKVTFDDVFPE